jgi:hypothetical protein
MLLGEHRANQPDDQAAVAGRFQRDAGMTSEAVNATGLFQRLFAAARADGYVTLDADGRERLKISPPSMVDLFNRYDQPHGPVGVPTWLYRVLSGYADARGWAMLRGASESDLEGFATGMRAVRLDWQLVCNLAERTVRVVERAVTLHIDYRTQ